MRYVATALLAFVVSGCAALAQGAAMLASLTDMADSGSKAWLARHPNAALQDEINAALGNMRRAQAALDTAIALDEGVDDARTQALAAYRVLVVAINALQSVSGGAETDAPIPEPIVLPAPDVVDYALGR